MIRTDAPISEGILHSTYLLIVLTSPIKGSKDLFPRLPVADQAVPFFIKNPGFLLQAGLIILDSYDLESDNCNIYQGYDHILGFSLHRRSRAKKYTCLLYHEVIHLLRPGAYAHKNDNVQGIWNQL